jgi:adenosylhomocysteine nucleosidase
VPRLLVILLTAVRMEHRAVVRRLGARPTSATTATLAAADYDVDLRTIGIGGPHLPAALSARTTMVLLAGLAGGLDPALRVGDVVVDGWPPGEAADANPPPFPTGLTTATARSAATSSRLGRSATSVGRIVTSPVPLTTPAAKADLFRRTGAVAVDMEGDAVRRLAAAARGGAGVPVVHVRAVSDAAGDAIDPAVLSLVDPVGRPRPLAVAAYVLRHPGRVPALARLGSAAATAAGRLAEAVADLLAAHAAAADRAAASPEVDRHARRATER